MIYSLVSLPQADDDLIRIWLHAADQQAVTDASNRIDKTLRRDPDQKGTLLDDGSRIYFDPPLAVTFTVSPDDRLVTIVRFQTI